MRRIELPQQLWRSIQRRGWGEGGQDHTKCSSQNFSVHQEMIDSPNCSSQTFFFFLFCFQKLNQLTIFGGNEMEIASSNWRPIVYIFQDNTDNWEGDTWQLDARFLPVFLNPRPTVPSTQVFVHSDFVYGFFYNNNVSVYIYLGTNFYDQIAKTNSNYIWQIISDPFLVYFWNVEKYSEFYWESGCI